MRRIQLFCAIGVGFLSVALAAGQAGAPVVLPQELRTHLQAERLGIVTSIRGLPLGVRDALQRLFGDPTLDIAEPGAPFQGAAASSNPTIPSRRLVAAGCSYDHCLVYYELAGTTPTWRVALFHWTPEETRFEGGGSAPGKLATIEEVRTALLSGVLRDAPGEW